MIIEQAIEHDAFNASCGCPGCGGSNPDFSNDASLDPSAGGTFNNKPIWTVDQIAAHLNRTGGGFANGEGSAPETNNGRQNNIGDDGSVITFGFFDTQAQVISNGYTYVAPNANGVNTLYGLNEVFNFAPMTVAQRTATREAMQSWDDVVAVSFQEASADDADMNFGNLASAPTTQAYARIPTKALDETLGGQVREIGGDSWISASQASNFQLDEGGYGLQTLAHEIGHSLGISHPGGYNAAPGRSITYAANAEYAQDTRAYSIMSYFQGSSVPGTRHFDFNISTIAYAGAPLIHDIAAAQRIYGADMTTRTGDTVYGFNSNAGRDAFDFTKTAAPISAIWDAGGIDTIDASGYATAQLIDLTPGSLSSIGGVTFDTAPSYEQVVANRTAAGITTALSRATYDSNMAALKANPIVGRLTDNFGIAYGVTIENAIGGSGKDTIIANGAKNILDGNGGDDLVSYRNALAGVIASLGLGVGSAGDAQGDTFIGIEGLEGSSFGDTLEGDAGNNVLIGLAGDDILRGGAGNDRLTGSAGKDRLEGGEGFDTASYSDATAGVNVTISNAGRITVTGGDTGDTLISIEAVEGSSHADTFSGSTNADTLSGGGGDDTLTGGNGHDTLDGGAGNDRLDGGGGNDKLFGGAGVDTILGGSGNDIIDGGAGADVLTGNTGSDVFIFQSAGDIGKLGGDHDQVTDFQAGVDKLDLSALFAGDEPVTITFVANAGAVGTDLNTIYVYTEGTGASAKTFVVGDNDGEEGLDFGLELTGAIKLKASDFITNSNDWDAFFTKIGSPNDYSAFHGEVLL